MEHLPTELLDEILSHLEVPDISSLRLASKGLQKHTTPAFIAAFATLDVDFSLANHEWLTNLSTSDDIRHAVRHLRIGIWNWRKTNNEGPYRDAAITFGRGRRWWRLHGATLDLTSATVRSTIAVLHQFANCTSVTVTTGGVWVSSQAPRAGHEGALSPTETLELVLHAYSLPGAPPLHRLRTAVSRKSPKNRPPGAPDGSVLGKNLQELTIELDREKKGRYRSRASDFLAERSRLKELRIMYCKHAFNCELAPKGGDLVPPLESLTLGDMSVRDNDLLGLISKFEDTLSCLSLYSVFLRKGTWVNVMEYLYATPFPALRQISMHGASSRHDTCHSISWCPLWRARDEVQASCGGIFEFGRGRVSNWCRWQHIIGVRFEAGPDGAEGVKRALRAMMGYQHTHLLEPRETGECESARAPEIKGVPVINGSVNQARYYDRWTGVPVE